MEASLNVPALAEGRRKKNGQWTAGVSGNRSGRPRKQPALPKGLKDHLADAMMEKIPLTDAEGKQEMLPAYEASARQLVHSLPTLKPRDLIAALHGLDKLGVYDEMRRRAGNEPEKLTLEQTKERVRARIAELQERSAGRV